MTAKPDAVDEDEPAKIADAVREMGLRFVVVTGVARDDLPDGGARIWATTIRAIRAAVPGCGVEVLPTDFKGGERDIATVVEAEPDVFAHNLETVRRLHGRIRPAFGYDRTLEVLRIAQRLRAGQVTKSNLILGMGERPDEIPRRCATSPTPAQRIVTIGQYLRPTEHHLPVDRWVTPTSSRGGRPWASRSGSRTSRPGRWCGAPTTPGSSSGARPKILASERWRSRPVRRILCRPGGRWRPSV